MIFFRLSIYRKTRKYSFLTNKDYVDWWVDFSEHRYSQLERGQRHHSWYPKDPFPDSMMLLFTRGKDDSDDVHKFGHWRPLHIAYYLAYLWCHLLPMCLLTKELLRNCSRLSKMRLRSINPKELLRCLLLSRPASAYQGIALSRH